MHKIKKKFARQRNKIYLCTPLFRDRIASSFETKNILRDGAEVARWAHNPKVVSSNLAPATTKPVNFIGFFYAQKLMYIVYVLYSKKFNKIYIGYTSNLEQRFLSHNNLSTKGYTKRYRPWQIAIQEEYLTKEEAILREKQLKGGQGRAWVWSKLEESGLICA